MLEVERREQIRRAYYIEGKSMRQIGQELRHSYWTIRDALAEAAPRQYRLSKPRAAPVLGPYKGRIDELLAESEKQPRKQRYTAHKIYQLLQQEGYRGSESSLRHYVSQQRQGRRRPPVYLPLSFEPGVDGQVDWGEATVMLAGTAVTVQLFVLRLCYSRKIFVMAFPTQRQEAFLAGHVAAFAHLGGVPQRLIYDNLKTAVKRVLEGRNRQEQARFVAFRSHYLFESRYCTPGAGNEKGQVEDGVGYARRNFMTPLLQVADYGELNAQLLAACTADEVRRVDRQPQPIGEMWQSEQPHLRPIPAAYDCGSHHDVTLNRYSQVVFETNRYSVPVELAQKHLVLKAYPFHIEILTPTACIAHHARCYAREQDILDPLHYLPLLAERPGAFEHATPMRQWRAQWPPVYEDLLAQLRAKAEGASAAQQESRAVRSFIQILMLHAEQPPEVVEQAITQALAVGMAHLEGVTFCLHRLLDPAPTLPTLPLDNHPQLMALGAQPLVVARYNQLLGGVL
ncbi:MAG: IS21 family transposase [Caldilineaceae bacterium]